MNYTVRVRDCDEPGWHLGSSTCHSDPWQRPCSATCPRESTRWDVSTVTKHPRRFRTFKTDCESASAMCSYKSKLGVQVTAYTELPVTASAIRHSQTGYVTVDVLARAGLLLHNIGLRCQVAAWWFADRHNPHTLRLFVSTLREDPGYRARKRSRGTHRLSCNQIIF